MDDYLPDRGSDREMELICVPSHIRSNFPPVFLMTATGDFLNNQPYLMAEKLTEVQVPFIYRLYGDKNHRLGHVFHCDIRSEYAKECNDDECNFFKSMIRQ